MDNRGITIIELILILTIMGIIVVIAVPKFNFSNSEMKRYGRELVMDLNYIKTKSKISDGNTNNKIRVSTIPSERNYYKVYIEEEENKTVYLDKKFELITNLNNELIYFTRIGIPKSAGSIIIYNTESGKYVKITITPATGRIHMYDEIKQGYKDDIKKEMEKDK